MKLRNIFAGLLASAGMLFALAPEAKADNGFAFSETDVIVSGTGCPGGSAFGIVNGDTVSIIFDSMWTEAEKNAFDRASCNIRMALDVPSGYTVQPVNIRYVGFANVPDADGARGTLNTYVSFANSGAWVDRTPFNAGFASDFQRNVGLELSAVNACTSPVETNFGINTILSAWGPRDVHETTSIGIDTMDVTLEDVVYQIEFGFIPCN